MRKLYHLNPDKIYKDGPFIFATGTIDIKVHKGCNPGAIETMAIQAGEVTVNGDGSIELDYCKVVDRQGE